MIIQNLWDAAKAVLTRKFIAIQSSLKRQEKSQIKNLCLYLKQLAKEEKTKPRETQNSQSNLENKQWSWRNQAP